MSAEENLPPSYDFANSDEDYTNSSVKLQKAIEDTKASASSVESHFKNVADRLQEACKASFVFRPDIQLFYDKWFSCYQVCAFPPFTFIFYLHLNCDKEYHLQLKRSGEIGSAASADAKGQ